MEFERWLEYFERNAGTFKETAETTGDLLTAEEKQRIGKSIAAFQLGEYSEGKHLMRAAQAFAARTVNDRLVRITRLFINEEQNHALVLARFMNAQGLPLSRRNWTDDVFRFLRKPVGFELSITVLITAEIISLVYYKALNASTGSSNLKRICTKILADESMHVAYETELIHLIRNGHGSLHRYCVSTFHALLFLGTTFVVYFEHRSVLNRGGYGLNGFAAAAWSEFALRFLAPKTRPAAVQA